MTNKKFIYIIYIYIYNIYYDTNIFIRLVSVKGFSEAICLAQASMSLE